MFWVWSSYAGASDVAYVRGYVGTRKQADDLRTALLAQFDQHVVVNVTRDTGQKSVNTWSGPRRLTV